MPWFVAFSVEALAAGGAALPAGGEKGMGVSLLVPVPCINYRRGRVVVFALSALACA